MRKSVLSLIAILLGLTFAGGVVAQEDYSADADPLASPKILTELPEEHQDVNRSWQGIPSVEVTFDNRVWITWFTGGKGEGEDNIVPLITSNDKGETWSKPLFAIDPQKTARAYDPSLWKDPKGRLWLFWAQGNISVQGPDRKPAKGPNGDKIRDCRAGVWCRICENPEAGEDSVWSDPRRLSDGLMLNRPIVDSRGQWLFPIAVWRRPSRYPVPEEYVVGPNVFITKDEGQTFEQLGHSRLAWEKSGWDEHNLVELSDGRLWLLARTINGMMEAYSSDEGKTWTDMATSPVLKNTASRFGAGKLQSGKIMIVKNGPAGEDVGRNTIQVSLSEDDGQTWSAPLVLDERNDVTYPSWAQAPDGTIYVTYDHGRYREKEILLARFTEEDIKAGKIVSEVGKLKILVNKAGK